MNKNRIISPDGKSWCYGCKKHHPIKFFCKDVSHWNGLGQLCKSCSSQHAKKYYEKKIKKYQQNKIEAVMYLGNKCKICGKKNLPIACFTFHHKNPSEKEFPLGELLQRRNKAAIKKELDKCDLLCFNCHQVLHHGIVTAAS